MTIKFTTCLSADDWQNLKGNDVFVTMLRNKVRVTINKTNDDLSSNMFETVKDYLNEVPEDFVYYIVEDIYGHKDIDVYFHNALDKENFFHYYNMELGVKKASN